MTAGIDEAEWWHTASLMSTVYAVAGIKKSPRALHPLQRLRDQPHTKEQIEDAAEADRIVWRAFCQGIVKRGALE
jgi:hypothetical protein